MSFVGVVAGVTVDSLNLKFSLFLAHLSLEKISFLLSPAMAMMAATVCYNEATVRKKVKKIETIKAFQLPIVVKQEGDFFVATCPEWPDCYAQGNSIDEATAEIIGVASTLIELYQEEGMRVPLVSKVKSRGRHTTKLSFNVPVFAS